MATNKAPEKKIGRKPWSFVSGGNGATYRENILEHPTSSNWQHFAGHHRLLK